MRYKAATLQDIPALQKYITSLFPESRFYNDPFFSREDADRLYRAWIENSVRGEAADIVFHIPGTGFISCRKAGEEFRTDCAYRGKEKIQGKGIRHSAHSRGDGMVQEGTYQYRHRENAVEEYKGPEFLPSHRFYSEGIRYYFRKDIVKNLLDHHPGLRPPRIPRVKVTLPGPLLTQEGVQRSYVPCLESPLLSKRGLGGVMLIAMTLLSIPPCPEELQPLLHFFIFRINHLRL